MIYRSAQITGISYRWPYRGALERLVVDIAEELLLVDRCLFLLAPHTHTHTHTHKHTLTHSYTLSRAHTHTHTHTNTHTHTHTRTLTDVAKKLLLVHRRLPLLAECVQVSLPG